jgi:hypothetical protein
LEVKAAEMSTRKARKKQQAKLERPIFNSIRKPLAPPGHPLSHAKPEEKANPAGRKAKHKRKPEVDDSADF